MKYSQLFIPTLKEAPADAETASHQYMVRAGLIRQLASGIYSTLPLGLRVLRKIENIIREEMNNIGGQELFLPSIQPAELWKESGRWDFYGKELLRIRDRHDREFCYGPTHEEVITDLVRKEVHSYKQLPLTFYQIQTKFRDEVRPRFGIMRGREFSMKDAYSFHADEESVNKTYDDMARAYSNIFERCGLEYKKVEADTGSIGGARSHEFHVLADSGEDEIGFCNTCDFASNLEMAQRCLPTKTNASENQTPPVVKEISTPGKKTIEEVTNFLSITPQEVIKTIVFESDAGLVAGLCRGDREINPIKLKKLIDCEWLHSADQSKQADDIAYGYIGPIGLKMPIYADAEIMQMPQAVAGANKTDFHLTGIAPQRDLSQVITGDLCFARADDPCPQCSSGKLQVKRGIELGHIFVLGDKYSKAMKANFLDSNGKEQTMVMGCYGIGVGRTAAAAIEQLHDEKGICWPKSIAPFQIEIIPVNMKDEETVTVSENLYYSFREKGLEILLDDRADRAGIKFKDADLLGLPVQIIIGPKTLQEGLIEIRIRKTGESISSPVTQAIEETQRILATL
ncbi:MAG: proline--tRNA ligase [Nitrospinae bacterium CG11_big_fil_rev_8_21_14_0_20_45_15]|nr:MAG: proline--tRNA ligase [Nitrospinae bacterium CG11_big_fil_rev_8_21_14_0_20_45_15]